MNSVFFCLAVVIVAMLAIGWRVVIRRFGSWIGNMLVHQSPYSEPQFKWQWHKVIVFGLIGFLLAFAIVYFGFRKMWGDTKS